MDILKEFWYVAKQMNLIVLKMIFVFENEINTFIPIQIQNELFNENVPYLGWLSTELFSKISFQSYFPKCSLRMPNSNEYYLPHSEIPQPR